MKYDVTVDMSTDNAHSLILRRLRTCSRVLDLGPAAGSMVKYMNEKLECEVHAVEIDEEAARRAEVYCRRMIVGDLNQRVWLEQLGSERFDHIVLADVLEHLYDPWAVLRSVVPLLKSGGTVLVSIPNVGHMGVIMDLLEGRFDYRETGLLDRTHFRFFTRKSVLELLDQAGLEVVEWLDTRVSPEHSEFRQRLEKFPGFVAATLKNKVDAEVYQFVLVARKKEEPQSSRFVSAGLTVVTEFIDQLYAYVWYEDHTGRVPLSAPLMARLVRGDEWRTYEIAFEVESMHRMIFVPMDRPGFIEIRKVRLLTPDGEKELSDCKVIQNVFLIARDESSLKVVCDLSAQVELEFTDWRPGKHRLLFEARILPGYSESLVAMSKWLAEKSGQIEQKKGLFQRLFRWKCDSDH